MKIITRFSIVVLLFIAPFMMAQDESLKEVTSFIQRGQSDSAKIIIDKLAADPSSEDNGYIWYLRGFIYKTIYNKYEKENRISATRLEALKSFKHSLAVDTTVATKEESKKNIKYLITTLYNDASYYLEQADYERGIETFTQFKEYYPLVDSSKKERIGYEIKFLLALGSVYSKMFEGDKTLKSELLELAKTKKNEFLTLAKDAYSEILKLDANNITANYNIGILYYTQAINLINQLDYGADLHTLNTVQDNSIALFRESLPFMEKSYTLDPNREETLYGLSGIYFSLNEIEKANEYKKKLDRIQKK